MLQKLKDGFLYGLGFMGAQIAVNTAIYLLMLLLGLIVHFSHLAPV